MEKENDTKRIEIPESIVDPQEREYFELMEKALSIAVEKKLPILCLTAYDDTSKALISTQGCPHCITKLISKLLDKEPQMFDIIMGAVAGHVIGKSSKDRKIVEYARKNSTGGN